MRLEAGTSLYFHIYRGVFGPYYYIIVILSPCTFIQNHTHTHTGVKAARQVSEEHLQSRTSQRSETSTYLHHIAGVSEVGEGAEGGEHRLRGSHQNPSTQPTGPEFVLAGLLAARFWKRSVGRTIRGCGVMEWKASQSLASPALHSSAAISPSSPLSISVSCGSNFKSLFFMSILTVGRWSVRERCLLLLHPPLPPPPLFGGVHQTLLSHLKVSNFLRCKKK